MKEAPPGGRDGLFSRRWGCFASRGREPARREKRRAAFSGSFYPAEPRRLEGAIRAYLEDAPTLGTERPSALILPHGRYIDSGQIAADGYRHAIGHGYDLVVILGAVHTSGGFEGFALHPGSAFETPLGVARIDSGAAAALATGDPECLFDEAAHGSEHSIEIHVPFVQVALPGPAILPLLVGASHPERCMRFGRLLATILAGRRALLIASSDLAVHGSREILESLDRITMRAMSSMDADALVRLAADPDGERPDCELDDEEMVSDEGFAPEAPGRFRGAGEESRRLCGLGAVLTVMEAARRLGATRGSVISYATSGDMALGARSPYVGFASVAFTTGRGERRPRAQETSDTDLWERAAVRVCGHDPSLVEECAWGAPSTHEEDRCESLAIENRGPLGSMEGGTLLAFARESIDRYLRTGTTPLFRSAMPALHRRQGAFVTLSSKGQLRGCVGHDREDRPLGQVVGAMALHAAFDDERFPPVRFEELDEIEIEISLLTPRVKIQRREDIVLGRHGILLRCRGRSAIFLPQVAPEQGWSVEATLSYLSRKAGLPEHAWQQDAELFVFETEILRESRDP